MPQDASFASFLSDLGRLETRHADVSFDAICDRLRDNPARAWRTFVEKYSKFVWSLGLKFARGTEDPEEFAAEISSRVFERLRADDYRRLHDFEGRCDFRTYLFQVVKTERFRLYRRRGVEKNARETLEGEAAAREEAAATAPTSGWARGLGRNAVQETLGQLDPADREILVLRFGSGLKLRELAEVLGARDTNDAAYRLRKALQKCQALARARESADWDEESFVEACETFRATLFQNPPPEVSHPDEQEES